MAGNNDVWSCYKCLGSLKVKSASLP
eukprot:UN14048